MSYTAPDYVDTKSQAILALASVIADEDKTALGDGSVNKALDVLADVLAESDVQVPQTNAGAILALAQYAGGMVKPEGAITITENGTGIDVAQYATADVSVSGGGSTITDVYLWNGSAGENANVLPNSVSYLNSFDGEEYAYTQLQIEPITTEDDGDTFYGVKVKDCPAGALFESTSFVFTDAVLGGISFGYSDITLDLPMGSSPKSACPMPIDGVYVVGAYTIESGGDQ